MSTVATTTHQTISSDKDRAKLLRRVMRESGWSMSANAGDDWQVVFRRTISGKPGDPDLEVTVRLEDRVAIVGKWGDQRSFHDSEIVYVPKPTRVWLHYASAQTAAKFLLSGSKFTICGSAGSTSSSKHGLAFVSLDALVGHDQIIIGDQSVYVHGRMVCCGSVE